MQAPLTMSNRSVAGLRYVQHVFGSSREQRTICALPCHNERYTVMILILAYLPTTIDNQLQHGQGDDDDRISNFISIHPFNDSSFAWQEGSLYFQCGSCHFQGK